jgi:hypothetical protein
MPVAEAPLDSLNGQLEPAAAPKRQLPVRLPARVAH